MIACPRLHCNGTLGIMGDTCSLCARTVPPARAPTVAEKHSRGRGAEQEADYFSGIYATDYVPTRDEITRARDW